MIRHVDYDTDLFVDLVHCGKVVHVLQVHVHLHDLLPGRAGSSQDVSEVLQALSLRRRIDMCRINAKGVTDCVLLDTTLNELAVLVDWCLAGQEDQAGNLCRMRYGRDQT